MNYFGWRGSPASMTAVRYTRTPGGMLTDREYRVKTMLSEDGDIVALGEMRVRNSSGGLSLKAAQVTIPRAALLLPEEPLKVNQYNVREKPLTRDLSTIIDPYLAMLDKMVEGAISTPIQATPALAAGGIG